MKLLTNITHIETAISSIATRGARLERDIWVAAVSAMAHHAKHGDVTIVNKLVAAMPKGSRVNALRDFITCHGKVTFDEENQVFVHDKEGNFDLEGATAKSWTEFKPEPKYQPVDAAKLIAALAKKLNADRKEGDKVTKAQVQAVNKMAGDLGIDITTDQK
ncbi:MAG: hypothetical protein HRU21_11745 [Pseudomonadales bacterium]|nr:hypothetical protein [Pseudomonadales bacterium]